MNTLHMGEARELLEQLERVRRAAERSSAQPLTDIVSPPLVELRSLVIGGTGTGLIEQQLRTVGRMALSDVQTRVYTRRWNIGARSFPHDFEQLLAPDPRAQVGDAYPYIALSDITWADGRSDMPPQIWITHREIRLAEGSIHERARKSVAARYAPRALSWSLQSAHSMGASEE